MAAAPQRSTPAVRRTLEQADALLVSTVIAFEFEDLRRRDRLPGAVPFGDLISAFDLDLASVPADLWRRAALLPDLHRDPVDRMLLAHGAIANVPIVTADRTMREYSVATIW